MGFFNKLKQQATAQLQAEFEKQVASLTGSSSPPTSTNQMTSEQFEKSKPDELRKDIRMISGCADHQTSADVSNVSSFQLPDPAGKAGGALTSTLLKVLYADERVPDDDLSFTEVLTSVRGYLSGGGYTQIPQLSSMNPIDVGKKFDLVPDTSEGVKRAVMIGINYVGDSPGELAGCWNDVLNMKKYIMNVVIIYSHYTQTAVSVTKIGHGTKLRDDDHGEEADGYDEALCPRDFASAGMIRDDDLYDILVKGCPAGVHMVSLMDCCHSGTIMDLPYVFKADGEQTEMTLDPDLNLDAFIQQITGQLMDMLKRFLP
eukprot:scaffold248441_cov63-Cyclotella_meneghiniana.AAC.1